MEIIRLHRPSGGFLDLMEAALCMNDPKDESGRYYFIDCNANPAFGVECAVGNVLNLYGIGFDEIIRRLIINVGKDEAQNNGNESA